MIVRKVAFEKTIGMPNYSNDRPIVVEADLEPGETKEQAWTRINQDMIAWHKKEYPHLYQEGLAKQNGNEWMAPMPPPENWEIQKDNPDETLNLIQNAPSLEILKTFKIIASSDPTKELYNAYCARIKELSK